MREPDVIDGRVGVSRVADIGRPLQGVPQELVLVRRVSLRVVRNKVFQIGNGIGKEWEVVKLAGKKRLSKVTDVINEELLGTLDVLGELLDDVNVHHVRQPHTSHRICRWFGQPDFLGNLHLLPLGGSGGGDRI